MKTKSKQLPTGNFRVLTKTGVAYDEIGSVLRISDNVIFAIGHYVTNGTRMRGKILEIETDNDVKNKKPNSPPEVYVVTDWSGVGMSLDSIRHIEPSEIILLTPSQFQVNDFCGLRLGPDSLGAQVTKVQFAEGKVLYDLDVAVAKNELTRIHGVDSVYVHALNESPTTLRWADPKDFKATLIEPKSKKKIRKKS